MSFLSVMMQVINDLNYGLTANLNKLQQMIKEKLRKVVEKNEIKKIKNNQKWYQLIQEEKIKELQHNLRILSKNVLFYECNYLQLL
jgi:uncharacterized ferritin-like protein (DUF455 family)